MLTDPSARLQLSGPARRGAAARGGMTEDKPLRAEVGTFARLAGRPNDLTDRPTDRLRPDSDA